MHDDADSADAIRILDYEPRHRDAFRDLNLEWIEQYFWVEESDRELLGDPRGAIIDQGGYIFVAESGSEVIGVCALVASGPRGYKLSKMAVSSRAQGKGAGRLLAHAAIERARQQNASEVELFSNTVLTPAITLYRSLGFQEVDIETREHERSNIRMILSLD